MERQCGSCFEYWLLFILNSYWLPQFLRNTLKNRSKPILWEFIFGTSFVRLAPLAYLCLDSSNPFRHPRNPVLLFTIFCWISAQILLLYLQSKLGARFWLNSKWLPEQYNYHPLINVKDLETGFSRDILSNLKVVPEQEVAMYESDCAICMSELKFPVMMTENGNKKTLRGIDEGGYGHPLLPFFPYGVFGRLDDLQVAMSRLSYRLAANLSAMDSKVGFTLNLQD